jgi:phosphoribosyl-ATP pyrophosphohydrolase
VTDIGLVLSRLETLIDSRRGADPTSSYSAKLLADPALASRKLGEEAVEVVVAALTQSSEALAAESADLVYHLLVVLAAKGVTLADVAACLEAREGTSGLAEKASRPKN